jgi:uncharacterized cupin superfamily protein
MVPEARLAQSGSGLLAATDGWFVGNVWEAQWLVSDHFAAACGLFEGDEAPNAQAGFMIGVLLPGQPSGLYHHESNQEDFLVLSGECVALVEGQERPLRAWDFLHCPPGTDHILVGAGEGPCIVFMAGARTAAREIVYPASELARRHRAGAESETSVPAEAYAPFGRWRSGRPATWDQLPWS